MFELVAQTVQLSCLQDPHIGNVHQLSRMDLVREIQPVLESKLLDLNAAQVKKAQRSPLHEHFPTMSSSVLRSSNASSIFVEPLTLILDSAHLVSGDLCSAPVIEFVIMSFIVNTLPLGASSELRGDREHLQTLTCATLVVRHSCLQRNP